MRRANRTHDPDPPPLRLCACTLALATGPATLYRNGSGNAALSLIGGAAGPALLDVAIRF